eukprot:gene10947-16837_t
MSGGDPLQAHLLLKQVELNLLMSGGMGGGSGTIANILAKLNTSNEVEQMQVLTDLCDLLSMSTEENLIGIRPDSIAPPLVRCMQDQNQEVSVLACRGIAYLMEALPGSVSSVVAAGAVPVFVEKLISMEVIDFAEQALLCLEKISAEDPNVVLREGGMTAMLTFVDFFSISLQRKIVASICNMARRVSSNNFIYVRDSLLKLAQLLTYEDTRLVEGVCQLTYRLLVNFQHDEEKLLEIGSDAMLQNLSAILQREQAVARVNPVKIFSVLKIFIVLAKRSVKMTQRIVGVGLVPCLTNFLKRESEANAASGYAGGYAEGESSPASANLNSPGLVGGSPAQRSGGRASVSSVTIGEIVYLIQLLLPNINTGLLGEVSAAEEQQQQQQQQHACRTLTPTRPGAESFGAGLDSSSPLDAPQSTHSCRNRSPSADSLTTPPPMPPGARVARKAPLSALLPEDLDDDDDDDGFDDDQTVL